MLKSQNSEKKRKKRKKEEKKEGKEGRKEGRREGGRIQLLQPCGTCLVGITEPGDSPAVHAEGLHQLLIRSP